MLVNDFTKNNHEHEYIDVDFVDASRVLKHIYWFCQQIFYFNNKLHRHVRIYRKIFSNNNFVVQHVDTKSSKNKKAQISLWKQFVIVSITSFNKNDEYNFRNWKYVTMKIIVVFQKIMKNLCLNIECTMSFINKKWFYVLNFKIIVRQIIDSIKIRDINDREYFNFDYINLNFYLKNKFKKNFSIIYIKKNVHVINNLKIKILINIDIICSKKMTTNLQTRKLIIDNYDISTSIICIFVDFKINRIARSHYVVIVFAYSILIVSFKTQNFALSNEKNYFFQSHVISFDFEVENDIIIYIINVKTFVIHVRNAIDKSIVVFKHIKLDKIFDFEKENCYHVDSTNVHLTIDVNWKRRVVIALIDFVVTIISILIKIKSIALSIYIVISINAYRRVDYNNIFRRFDCFFENHDVKRYYYLRNVIWNSTQIAKYCEKFFHYIKK